ncbi:hypothetical protein [Parvularcula marina]|uniref:Lipoprotein n=1 Tax=Parvularcula marina TaxID=2292771 RepID=A0A371RKA4_9PROT|nr:hypothetical protein [Parvularcula marina]RFB05898.1 hypothetical protein DX908_11850 [Parvularcula marina]
MDRRLLIALSAALGVAACASPQVGDDGAYYPAGYSDGCRTAEAIQSSFGVKRHRDEHLFKTEPSYQAGWRAGYTQCRRMDDLDNRPGDLGEWETY